MSAPYTVVVGATGWVGRSLVSRAKERGLAGAAVSRQRVVGPWPSYSLGELERLAGHPGAVVVNAAGAMQGDETTLRQANVQLVEFLSRTCRDAGARLVSIGSAAEYGTPVGPLVAESDSPHPTTAYGRSKLAATQVVLDEIDAGLCATVVRVFNLVGSGRLGVDPISDFARAVNALPASGGVVRPFDSSLVRDLLGLHRAADLVLDLCEHVGEAPLVNVCSGRGVSFRDLIEAMGAVRGVPVRIEDTSPGGIPRVVGDTRLLFQLLGVREPQTVHELAVAAMGTM